MITDAGNALANQILEMSKENDRIATVYAIQYAQSDDKDHKVTFEKYSSIANTYNDIHRLVCQGLHEMRKKYNDTK